MKKLLFSLSKDKGDFILQVFRAGGPGGQNQNKVSSGVRILHPASGAIGESRAERTQGANKKLAFIHLTNSPKFKLWIKKVTYEMDQLEPVEKRVARAMRPENLRIECKESGKWSALCTELTNESNS